MNKFVPLLLFFFITGSFVAAFNSVSASSLVEDSWNTKTSMSQNRHTLGVAVVDGKIYAIGGFACSGYLDTNEQYDPVTDTWTTLTSMPTPRNSFAIAAYQGKIYCIGGITSNEHGYFWCGVNEVYDVATDSWSTKASLPVNSSYSQTHVVDGKIFVIMGCDLYMYDPVIDVWTEKTRMSIMPVSLVSFVLPTMTDKIVVIAEFPITGSPNKSSEQKVIIYDTKTDMWCEGTNPPPETVRGFVGVTTGVYAPQRVYVLGVYDTFVYDPTTALWASTTSMLTPRYGFGVAVVDDVLYVIGGSVPNTGVQFLSVNEQYVPIGYHETPTTVTPGSSSSSKHHLDYLVITVSATLTFGVAITFILFKIKRKWPSKKNWKKLSLGSR